MHHPSSPRTVVSVAGQAFCINGRPTYEARRWRGSPIEGLLLNSRMVQGIFDDLNPQTRRRWDYPDGPWDAERNVREFVAAMPSWRACGLGGFTINLQGGCPYGYCDEQPWWNSAFEPDGALRGDYMVRLERVLDRADALGMVVILGLFYFGQDQRLDDEAAVVRAVDAAVDWLVERASGNVVVEVDNEADVPQYEHAILTASRVAELIVRVQERSAGRVASPAGRLLAGTSMGGGSLPPPDVVETGDVLLLHGNGVGTDGHGDPDGMRKLIDDCRAIPAYREQPIVVNEDDHYDFDAADSNFLAAVQRYAGWGFFDYRRPGEGYAEGYQCVPVDWRIASRRKRAFFDLVAEMTGA